MPQETTLACGPLGMEQVDLASVLKPGAPPGPDQADQKELEDYQIPHRPLHPRSPDFPKPGVLDETPDEDVEEEDAVVSPPPVKNFEGGRGRYIPPDTHGAVSRTQIVMPLNDYVYFYDHSGTCRTNVSLKNFWGRFDCIKRVHPFDPKILYDPTSDKFVFVTMADARKKTAGLMIAVSTSGDPTAHWNGLIHRPRGRLWYDYPSIGISADKIVVSVNIHTLDDKWYGFAIYAFNKKEFYEAKDSVHCCIFIRRTGPSDSWFIAPSFNHDTENDVFLVRSKWGSFLELEKLVGTVEDRSEPKIEHVANVRPEKEKYGKWAESVQAANFLPQKSTHGYKVAQAEDRIQNLVLRNGSLWCCQTVFLPRPAPTKSHIQWWRMDLQGNLQQFGRIEQRQAAPFFDYASIAVNKNDDALVGMSVFSPKYYLTAGYAYKKSTESAFRRPHWYRKGEADYFLPSPPHDKNRWGDYSATVVDPVDDTHFWTCQEYARPHKVLRHYWGTWWAKVKPS